MRNVSFEVSAGEIFCIMGLSGSGKSTLVRHLNRLIEPTHGQVLINGEDVGALSPEELRALRANRIGMVFQNMALLPHRTVRDNIAFALEQRNADTFTRHQVADRVIETVNLEGYGDRMPSELSGGMQQRVGLARTLAADPEILPMDEPFSALDPLIRRGLQDEFLELSRTKQVPESTKEAALAFGASPKQMMMKVELPLALPSIMTGVNQVVMTSLSMVVIAAIIGAQLAGSSREVDSAPLEDNDYSGNCDVVRTHSLLGRAIR